MAVWMDATDYPSLCENPFSHKTTSQWRQSLWLKDARKPTLKDAVLSPGSDDAFTDSLQYSSPIHSDVMADHNFARQNYGTCGASEC